MAYDAARGQVLLFGGYNGTNLDDTWMWDGTNWTQKNPANSPSPTFPVAGMAFDSARGQVVLFISNPNPFAGSVFSDTWVWDGMNWTKKNPLNSPPPRTSPGMAYDTAHGQVVLFGGNDAIGNPSILNDTWVWDGTNWTKKSPMNSPSRRYQQAMAYDSARGQVVLFGGEDGNTPSDTWVWDGTNWTKKNPANSPSQRNLSAMAYDSAREEVVLFGGTGSSGLLNDTWVFTASTVQRPLIFIPGIAGSSLNKEMVGPDNKVWPYQISTGISFNDLTLDPAYSPPDITPIDAIRAIPAPVFDVTLPGAKRIYGPLLDMLKTSGGYREYKVDGDPSRRTTAGCDMNQQQDQPNLFVFAYDWRISAATNAQMLKDYVGCVQRLYPGTEVDILTHSFGGLVARRYILDNPSPHVVNKMITIAAPWLGAPKAINTLETGLFFDNVVLDRLNSGALKRLVEFFPGAHQLIPSRGYYALGGLPFTELEWDADGNGTVNSTYTDYTQLVNMLDHRYSNPSSRPGTRGKIFHDNSGQDNWNVNDGGFNPDPTINYFHVYGRQPAPKTIGNVYTRVRTICNFPGFNCHPVFGYDVLKTYGDGTVPEFSASRLGNGHNYNALNATQYSISTSDDHTGLAQNSSVLGYILYVLLPAQFAPPIGLTSTKTEYGQTVISSGPAVVEQAYYLNISGPASVIVTDAFGHSNAPADGTVFGGEVPGVTTDMLDAETFFIAMSTVNTYTITLRTGTESIALELTKGTDTETVQAIRYLDVTLPGNVTAMLRVTPQGVDDLRYDGNNDGTFETAITPTASVSGAAAQDTEPPNITVSEARQATGTTVTLAATDNASGVGAVYYSLDGSQYQTYISPLSVDPYRSPFIYAFADDNVANRSGLVTHQLSAPVSTLQFSQTSYSVNESVSFATINITRPGDTSGTATVKYATSDATDVNFLCNPNTAGQVTGAASRKCDYHIAAGRLRFAPGENTKQIVLSIVNDVYVEGPETLAISLSSPTGATLGSPNTATVTITDNDTPGQANPIDGTAFYVRMLYVDLLSREPDPAGNVGWIHRIDFCGQPGEPPPPCDRVTVGGDGFLRSTEFFDREFFVIRLYRTALGRILRYDDVSDPAFVSGFLTDADLELNKQELVTDIMSRAEFSNMYNLLTNSEYADTMISTAAVTLPAGVRDGWVNALNGGTKTRAQVFRELSERSEVSAKYLHEAQVVSCYYGFFTRNPDGAYFNYLQRLDSGEINLGDLANAFINAVEYRQRFGP
jgi:pimeloyl-ACP methyl ester carboxylesterase